MFTSFHASTLVVEKKKPLSIEEIRFCDSEVVAITLPCALVERSAEVTPERTKLVVVAVPETVRPPVTDPLPMVVEAWKTLDPVKVLFEYDFTMVVDASVKYVAEVVENAFPWFCARKY